MAKRRLATRGLVRRKLRESTVPLLPTLMTLANGVCGLGSITLATSQPRDSKLAFFAGVLVFAGMLFDVLDGQIARLTRRTSRFGAELDSLCDMITFGVAPVFIMFTFSDFFYHRLLWGQHLLWGIGALYTVSAVLRLARFNVQKVENEATTYFKGLPSPVAAGTVASFAIAMPALQELASSSMPDVNRSIGSYLISSTMIVVPILTLVVACLMVSRIKYPHIARVLGRRHSFYQLAELAFALVVAITFRELALPLVFCYLVFAPPLNELRVKAFAGKQGAGEACPPLPSPEDA